VQGSTVYEMAIGHTLKVLINCVPTVSDHIESRFVVLKSPDRDRFIKGEDGEEKYILMALQIVRNI